MADLQDHFSFKAPFAKVARTEISEREAKKWDPELSRDPSLLVPVDVRALVVASNEQVEHALVGSVLIEGGKKQPQQAPDGTPPPFTDAPSGRAPGVYLHWALPDGLMRGRAEEGGEVSLRPLPSRWLVMRLEGGDARKRRLTGWVLESERATVMDYKRWRPGRAPDVGRTIDASELTAAVGGDLAWTAIFDSARNRFALYDDLTTLKRGNEAGTLTYIVVGWYADAALDPLYPAAGDPPFDELMREFGWTIDEARLEAARAQAESLVEAVSATRALPTPPLTVAGVETDVEVADQEVDVPATDVPAPTLTSAGDVGVKVAPWRPQRSIYHGTVFGVRPDGGTFEDPRPASSSLRVAIGGTGSESMARLLAAAVGGDVAEGERLQTAFAYDLIDVFDRVDGMTRLEEEIHLRGFAADSGGLREETVRTGDPLAEAPAGAEPEVPPSPPREGRSRGRGRNRAPELELSPTRYGDVLDRFARDTRPEVFEPPSDPPRTEPQPRGGARYWHPQEPQLMIQGLKRSLRHGFDGRYEPDERVACRLSGDPVSALAGVVQGVRLLENRIEHGGLPAEAEQLLIEAAIEDPFAVADIAAVAAAESGADKNALERRLDGEKRLMLRSQAVETDAARLTAASLKEGVEPSPLAVTIWQGRPWIPLLLEWELELRVDGDLTRWELGELDLRPRPNAPVAGPPIVPTFTGRTLLNAATGKVFADQVNRFLDQEDRLDAAGQGVLDEEDEMLLRRTATEAVLADVLSGSFDGLRERLLGFDTNLGEGVPEAQDPRLPAPTAAPLLVRGGEGRLRRLRVVDAFGRTLELQPAELARVALAEVLRMPDAAATDLGTPIYLAPRITAPSRLHLRLLDAEDDAHEATLDQAEGSRNPVAAIVVPDFVDGALEFFDRDGAPLGQLREEAIGGGVGWESAPGTPAVFGAAPAASIANRHAAAFATAVVQRDAADRDADIARSESALAALLRVIDTTFATIDPVGSTGNEHLAMLVGHPLAVVRAELRLEVVDDTDHYPGIGAEARAKRVRAFAELAAKPFEVRLGALTRFSDGLVGYFVGNDYSRFRPVHPSVAAAALPSGPRAGFLAGPVDAQDRLNPRPIVQSYLDLEPTLTVRPGETVRLTLLMDPGSIVHATTGVLPRKSIALLRDWTVGPLERLSPSFRIGPTLIERDAVRMPSVSGLPREQLWSRRDRDGSWRDDPIMAATKEAELPELSPLAQEGYVRARAPRKEEQTP